MVPPDSPSDAPDDPVDARDSADAEDPDDSTQEIGVRVPAEDPPLRLIYSAISDVGRVRKDNQDSGYAGPHLLAVCDGVGGAARGDIASATSILEISRLDDDYLDPNRLDPDRDDDLLARVAGSLHRAHDRIGELVDADPALNGTSTTAVVALFDGRRFGIGHVGDSRAYLLREGELSQLTIDHTFVQTLIEDGRITPEEARTHPHRNLILRAIDSVHTVEPDLFNLEVEPGDRLMLCSDGVLSLTDDRIADIMMTGTADYVAVELIRAALEAGSTDNITSVVADVIGPEDELPDDLEPLLVGAATEQPRRSGRGTAAVLGGLLRGRSAESDPEDGGAIPSELEFAIETDPPIDPETARYAPRPPEGLVWVRRLLGTAVVLGLLWVGLAFAWSWSQEQYFVGTGTDNEGGEVVMIYRGLDADLPGVELAQAHEMSNVSVDMLSDYQAGQVRDGIDASSLDDARETVANLAETQEPVLDEEPAT